jgi:adenine-specific DNA-methyltransferase
VDPIASTETRRQAALGKLDLSTHAVLGQFSTAVKDAALMAMLRLPTSVARSGYSIQEPAPGL